MPEWVKQKRYKVATVGDTCIFLFGAADRDGQVHPRECDLPFLVNPDSLQPIVDFEPTSSTLRLPAAGEGLLVTTPKGPDPNNRYFEIDGLDKALFNCHADPGRGMYLREPSWISPPTTRCKQVAETCRLRPCLRPARSRIVLGEA